MLSTAIIMCESERSISMRDQHFDGIRGFLGAISLRSASANGRYVAV